MRLTFLILFIFLITFQTKTYGQIRSGQITYKVRPPQKLKYFMDTSGIKQQSVKDVVLKDFFKTKKMVPFLTYVLKFNSNAANFNKVKTMNNDNGMNLEIASANAGARGVFYTNINKNLRLHQFEGLSKLWLISSKISDLTWNVTNETKVIQGYTCQKATTKVQLNARTKGVVTAWFCPQLPFHFGPLGFSGLPGLILGLKRNHFYFYATKIKLSEKEETIKQPTNDEIVTKREFYRITNKIMQRNREER